MNSPINIYFSEFSRPLRATFLTEDFTAGNVKSGFIRPFYHILHVEHPNSYHTLQRVKRTLGEKKEFRR